MLVRKTWLRIKLKNWVKTRWLKIICSYFGIHLPKITSENSTAQLAMKQSKIYKFSHATAISKKYYKY